MKKFVFALAFVPLAASAVTVYDSARVISAVPQVEEIRVKQPCRTVTVTEQQEVAGSDGVGGSILGGVVGGLLGNQIGGGSGRTVATAAGAITGAIVGGNMDRTAPGTREVTRERQVCEPDRWESVTTGYKVTYEYKGERGTVITERDPGRSLEMRVTAEPIGR